MSTKTSRSSADFLTVAGLAQALGVCKDTVRRLDAHLSPLRTQAGGRLYAPGALPKARALLRSRRWWRRRQRARKAAPDV